MKSRIIFTTVVIALLVSILTPTIWANEIYQDLIQIIDLARESAENDNSKPPQPTSGMIVGDVNNNGTPFEVADAVLFTKYFIYGETVFTVSQADQIAATDINGDGETLKLEDLVQLVAIAAGKIDPSQTVDITLGGNNFVQNNTTLLKVFLNTEHTADVFWLKFEGELHPHLPADTAGLYPSYYDGTYTRVLVTSLHGFGPGFVELFRYLGSGEIKSAQGATFGGEEIDLSIDLLPTDIGDLPDILPTAFVVHQNYPNPFNNETRIAFELPNASIVQFEVFNLLGQTVYRIERRFSAGIHSIPWEGQDKKGNTVATGVYYYRLIAGVFIDSKKMILLK